MTVRLSADRDLIDVAQTDVEDTQALRFHEYQDPSRCRGQHACAL